MKKFSRKENIGIFVALSVIVVFFLIMPSSFSSIRALLFEDSADKVEPIDSNVYDASLDFTVQNLVEGTGKPARVGDQLSVHYVGRFTDGEVFDSSVEKGVPFTFTLGEGLVIEGWERGLLNMKVGGRRVLVIPPELAYGKEGRGPIPPDSTLIFEIELLEILP